MYQALLTRRYLLSKVMPLLSAAAVMLCTAMVIIVWSVMGGFLTLLLDSGRSMIGDVSIEWPIHGIPRYEALIERLEADPMVERATPAIETLGLITFPSGSGNKAVSVIGIDPDGYNQVTDFFDNLWWRPLDKPLPKDTQGADPRLAEREYMEILAEAGQNLEAIVQGSDVPRDAMVTGIELIGLYDREPQGFVTPGPILPGRELTLQVMPVSRRGVPIKPVARSFVVANEIRTGLYQADSTWVLVPIDALQEMLMLDEAERVLDSRATGVTRDDEGNESFARSVRTRTESARATTIMLRAADGFTPNDLLPRAREIYESFYQEMSAQDERPPRPSSISIYTWKTKPGVATFISAVEKETALVLVLFAFISLTAVFLVFAIFWSMISEKTKDIGILRALGASKLGITWLFVRYGLAIGIVGSFTGGLLALLIVRNINPIHEWLGEMMGLTIWDPSVYYFTEIPNRVDPAHATIVLGSGIAASALGAFIPALRAANMDPVKALRFE